MKRIRLSIAVLMAAVATIAVNIAVMRSFDPDSLDSLPHFFYATGAMPVASLLIMVGALSALKLSRTGEITPFVVGFIMAGWTAVFASVTLYSIATRMVLAVAGEIATWLRPLAIPYLNISSANLIGKWIEITFLTVLLSLPRLMIALLGGWISRRVGLVVRVAIERSPGSRGADIHAT